MSRPNFCFLWKWHQCIVQSCAFQGISQENFCLLPVVTRRTAGRAFSLTGIYCCQCGCRLGGSRFGCDGSPDRVISFCVCSHGWCLHTLVMWSSAHRPWPSWAQCCLSIRHSFTYRQECGCQKSILKKLMYLHAWSACQIYQLWVKSLKGFWWCVCVYSVETSCISWHYQILYAWSDIHFCIVLFVYVDNIMLIRYAWFTSIPLSLNKTKLSG